MTRKPHAQRSLPLRTKLIDASNLHLNPATTTIVFRLSELGAVMLDEEKREEGK